MKPFELMQSPLGGVQLIEAGAGTGKTYSIAGLFLRLIVEKALGVHEILVVTYTKAATEELKDRVRQRLVNAKNQLNNEKLDPFIKSVVENSGGLSQARQRILDALTDFDRAAIFTIHGFCQRILNHFAFETGYMFEARLAQDDQPLVTEMADDFWRSHICPAPPEVVTFALKYVKGPDTLAALFSQCRAPQATIVPLPVAPPLEAIEDWRDAVGRVRDAWPAARPEILALLASESLNARFFGKIDAAKDTAQRTSRQATLSMLAQQMDGWNGSYPYFDNFQRFTASYLAKATKKTFPVPRHSFFELCEHACACQSAMEAQMAAHVRYLKVRLLHEARQRLEEKKRRSNVLFFDDLLIQVHHALQGRGARDLVQAVRQQYRAALVDEFQDTDALQYEIFTRLFAGNDGLLFMIGDPKQAIYSFRGADLFSYLKAKRETPHRYTLARNWRSTPPLVQAVNALFGGHSVPFGYDQIAFPQAVAGRSDPGKESVPFHLWYLTRGQEEGPIRPISQEAATDLIVAAVAEEMVSLLSANRGQEAVQPGDVAVLTRTHRQAQKVKNALSQRGVPAVLHSAGSVFETPEAGALALVLEAVATPSDPIRARAAMACDLIAAQAQELCAAFEGATPQWQTRWARFDSYHRIWQQKGFYAMFSRLMDEEMIKPRLLGLPEGERRLTNLLHLAELLQQSALANSLTPEGLLAWFEIQRRGGRQDEDVQKLRLESDAQAVRIITIHKSKGLQFEVVFCPFVWTGAKVDDDLIVFHDPERDYRLTYAIGPEIDLGHGSLALQEALAENIRLLYVAVTRAKRKCYLAWGCIKSAEISAPAYLLHGPRQGNLSSERILQLRNKMAAMTDAQLIEELDHLARRSEGTIRIEPLPRPSDRSYDAQTTTTVLHEPRQLARTLDAQWRIASFSGLTAGAVPHDAGATDRDADEMPLPETANALKDETSIFTFPKGARAGLFFHDLLEKCDFGISDPAARKALVAAKLQAHGFENEWIQSVDGMLSRLGQVRLGTQDQDGGFCLADVPWHRRVNEMAFHFPLKRIDPRILADLMQDDAGLSAGKPGRHWDRMYFSPVHGCMKGFIDMIFLHDGRYYLVDWKSNHLGCTVEDYTPQRLAVSMADAFYDLQYHLYVVALDQWLRTRIDQYRYDEHFGGVYYLFLRGIGEPSAETGIFYDLPSAHRIERLRDALLDLE